MYTIATPVIYGTAIFARINGKLRLIGTPVCKPNVIGPMEFRIDRNTVVNLPLLRKVN